MGYGLVGFDFYRFGLLWFDLVGFGFTKLIKFNMALDFKNTTFLRPTFSPKNRLNTFYRKINTAWL